MNDILIMSHSTEIINSTVKTILQAKNGVIQVSANTNSTGGFQLKQRETIVLEPNIDYYVKNISYSTGKVALINFI